MEMRYLQVTPSLISCGIRQVNWFNEEHAEEIKKDLKELNFETNNLFYGGSVLRCAMYIVSLNHLQWDYWEPILFAHGFERHGNYTVTNPNSGNNIRLYVKVKGQ